MADREPEPVIARFDSHRAIVQTHANGPESSNLFQMQTRVRWVVLEQLLIPVGDALHLHGQRAVAFPKASAAESRFAERGFNHR